MAQSRSLESSSPRSLKRKRQSSNDEDIENIMPPTKQAMHQYPHGYPSSAGSNHSSSSQCSSDDGFSNFTLDERVSNCTDALSSEESSPICPSDVPQEVLSPLHNLPINKQLRSRKNRQNTNSYENRCPLPSLPWADHQQVWEKLCERDTVNFNERSTNMLEYHPSLKPRMRSILLDWLNEVSEVYKLHRETFHLCVYYIDRYLNSTEDVHKNRLQLIGITCLFIAAKVEEVYPPKVADFAYVTDGACTQENILTEELAILSVLNWSISPITTYGWLNMYMQLRNDKYAEPPSLDTDGLRNYTFLFTQYSSLDFVICAQLIDLALLDVEVNAFKYSQLAAAAIAHCFDKKSATRVSGYLWEELVPCFNWLKPFAQTLLECGSDEGVQSLPNHDGVNSGSDGLSKICPDMNPEQSHRMQIHNVTMGLFDKVEQYVKLIELSSECSSTETTADLDKGSLLTPPDSSHKKHAKKSSTFTPCSTVPSRSVTQ